MIDLSSIFNNAYGFISLFLIILSASFGFVPGLVAVIISYASFASSIKNLAFLMLLILIASLIGDCLVYFLARLFSDKVKKFLTKFNWFNKNEQKVNNYLKKYEFPFVFFSRFLIAGFGPIINYISGFEKLNAKKFILAVFLGEALYALIYSSIGYFFKDTWLDLMKVVQNAFILVLSSLLVTYLIYKIIKFYKKRRGEKNVK